MDRYTIFSGEQSDEGAVLKRPVATIAAPSVEDGDWRRHRAHQRAHEAGAKKQERGAQ